MDNAAPEPFGHVYQYSDLCVHSNVEIPFLPAGEPSGCDLKYVVMPASEHELSRLSASTHRLSPDEVLCEPLRDGHWMQMTPHNGFYLDGGMRQAMGFWTSPSSQTETSRLFVDHVLPRILATQTRFILHASCVAYENHAILFIGKSGRGKSTLALAHCQLQGAELISDDCVELTFNSGRLFASPTYRAHRVWSDSYEELNRNYDGATIVDSETSKFKLVPTSATTLSCPVVAAYFVAEESQETGTQKLTCRESVMELMRQTFHFHSQLSKTEFDTAFDRCQNVYHSVPCMSLLFPRDYDSLPAVVHATKFDLSSDTIRSIVA